MANLIFKAKFHCSFLHLCNSKVLKNCLHYDHNVKNEFGLQKNGKNLIISEKLKILPKCYGPHFEH